MNDRPLGCSVFYSTLLPYGFTLKLFTFSCAIEKCVSIFVDKIDIKLKILWLLTLINKLNLLIDNYRQISSIIDLLTTFSMIDFDWHVTSCGHLAYVQTRPRTNSPTTCQLAYVGEFTQVMYAFYNFMLSFCEQCPKYFFVWIASALDERTRNNTFYTTVGDNELAYAGVQICQFTSRRRRVDHFKLILLFHFHYWDRELAVNLSSLFRLTKQSATFRAWWSLQMSYMHAVAIMACLE